MDNKEKKVILQKVDALGHSDNYLNGLELEINKEIEYNIKILKDVNSHSEKQRAYYIPGIIKGLEMVKDMVTHAEDDLQKLISKKDG